VTVYLLAAKRTPVDGDPRTISFLRYQFDTYGDAECVLYDVNRRRTAQSMTEAFVVPVELPPGFEDFPDE